MATFSARVVTCWGDGEGAVWCHLVRIPPLHHGFYIFYGVIKGSSSAPSVNNLLNQCNVMGDVNGCCERKYFFIWSRCGHGKYIGKLKRIFNWNKLLKYMVLSAGIEPARHCCQGILSPSCLPIPPREHRIR